MAAKGENAGYQHITTQSLLLTPLRKKPLENIVGRGENAGNYHFLLFPQSSYPSQTNFKFLVSFILSSANAFNLNKSIILLFGNELTSTNLCITFVILMIFFLEKNQRQHLKIFHVFNLAFIINIIIK